MPMVQALCHRRVCLFLALTLLSEGVYSSNLTDLLLALQFRNPEGVGISRSSDVTELHPQCVLYSETDNVSTVNQGWDVIDPMVGWQLQYPYNHNHSIPPTGIRSAVPLGGMGTGNFELRGDGTFRQWCLESQSPGGGAKLDIGALDEAALAISASTSAGSHAALLRTRAPGGLTGVDAIQYEGAVPVSKLTVLDDKFPLDFSLFAHGELVPWDPEGSMTPAVAFTLVAHNPTQQPANFSLMLSLPLAIQHNTARVELASTPRVASNATTDLQCRDACLATAPCASWSFDQQTLQCSLILNGTPQNVYQSQVSSGINGKWSLNDGTLVHQRQASTPTNQSCTGAAVQNSTDINGVALGATMLVPVGQAGLDMCRASCCSQPSCTAWVVADATAPAGATPAPCQPGQPCCWHKSGAITARPACTYCTSAVGHASDALDEQVGDFGMHVRSDPGTTAQAYTSDALSEMFSAFATGQPSNVQAVASHGAVSAQGVVAPNETASVTIVLGWHFAKRYFTGQQIGNYYASLHASGSSAATGLSSRLLDTIQNYIGFHQAFFEADSTPPWLQDMLVNSMSQWRTAFMTADGRWRQWEAYDCVDVDSVHNDYQRQLPYAVFFPQLVQNTMTTGWAKLQQADGMITESLSGGCMAATGVLDGGGGRVMGDVSTIYAIEALQLFEWTADEDFLQTLQPSVLRALDWVIKIGTGGTPLPKRQCCTYDIIDFEGYDHTTFNSFIYLAALRACARLAEHWSNQTLATECSAAYTSAVPYLNSTLYNTTDHYFRAWADSKLGAPAWLMADSLYGQVVANTLGLSAEGHTDAWLVPPEMIAGHLAAEAKLNPSPYGLTVVTTSGSPPELAQQEKVSEDACAAAVNGLKYDSVWMGAAPDWCALQISLGDQGVGVAEALAMAQKGLDHYRSTLRDQWNIHGLVANDGYGVDGQSWCTAHYGFHMTLWHIPFAMSGQVFSAVSKSLIFRPKLPCPFTLTTLVTGAVGTLQCDQQANFTLKVTLGHLQVNHLEVTVQGQQTAIYQGAVDLTRGQTVEWH
eukprot:TRINITY_DN8636_c0_g2_i1.p1 TRINITY_DN8636_c0_g2~~TRINITY_DN8636_c0_g2_i1.p1  ORF type:complete len:1042 (-),score=198.12 TRINITY_DN8636_c0_g2_i1:161-3286(-)